MRTQFIGTIVLGALVASLTPARAEESKEPIAIYLPTLSNPTARAGCVVTEVAVDGDGWWQTSTTRYDAFGDEVQSRDEDRHFPGVRETESTYGGDRRLVRSTSKVDGKPLSVSHHSYDGDGLLTEIVTTPADPGRTSPTRERYRYREGLIVEVARDELDDGTIDFGSHHRYDDLRRLTEVDYFSDSRMTSGQRYQWDGRRLRREAILMPDGTEILAREYDGLAILGEVRWVSYYQGVAGGFGSWFYTDGRPVRGLSFRPNGELEGENTLRYDHVNRLIHNAEWDPDAQTGWVRTLSYDCR